MFGPWTYLNLNHLNNTLLRRFDLQPNIWYVSKVSVLIFYLNVNWTHLKLQVISFKVWPLGSYTMVPTFFFSTDHSSTGSHFP